MADDSQKKKNIRQMQKNTMDTVFDQISDNMGFIKEKKVDLKEGDPTAEVRVRIDAMKDLVNAYKESLDDAIRKTGEIPRK